MKNRIAENPYAAAQKPHCAGESAAWSYLCLNVPLWGWYGVVFTIHHFLNHPTFDSVMLIAFSMHFGLAFGLLTSPIIMVALRRKRLIPSVVLLSVLPPVMGHLLIQRFPEFSRFTLFVIMLAYALGLITLRVALPNKPRKGHCRSCGYSTVGLPGPRCPECGRSI